MSNSDFSYSIEDGQRGVSGAKTALYLDPSERHVFTFQYVGNLCCPMKAHNRLHLSLGGISPINTVGESLEAWLREHEAELAALCDCYEGDGRWSESLEELDHAWDDLLDYAFADGEIVTYIDADYWLATDSAQTVTDTILAGSVELAAEQAVDNAQLDGGHVLDQDDAEAAIRRVLKQHHDLLNELGGNLNALGKVRLGDIEGLLA